MSFITGTGTRMCWSKEGTFNTAGTAASASLINLTSEGLAVAVEKGDEGSLLASKTASSRALLGITSSGSVSSILRPEFADLLLELALGKKSTAGSYTLADAGSYIPSFTVYLDRGTGFTAYTGMTINSTTIDCAAGDFVKVSNDLMGTGNQGTVQTADVTALNGLSYKKPSYRCTNASLTKGGTAFDVSSCSITINNALVEAPKVYSSGLYRLQPKPAQREVTVSLTIPYSADIDAFAKSYLTTEENVALVLKFTSTDTANEYITVTMPAVAVTSVTNNVSGTGLVEASIEGTALSVSGEPITVALHTASK